MNVPKGLLASALMLLALFCFASPPQARAGFATLDGYVYTHTWSVDQYLPDAAVSVSACWYPNTLIQCGQTRTIRTYYTDSAGYFQTDLIYTENVPVTVEKKGYYGQSQLVPLFDNATITVQLQRAY